MTTVNVFVSGAAILGRDLRSRFRTCKLAFRISIKFSPLTKDLSCFVLMQFEKTDNHIWEIFRFSVTFFYEKIENGVAQKLVTSIYYYSFKPSEHIIPREIRKLKSKYKIWYDHQSVQYAELGVGPIF